jgi:hypothetical protein
MDKASRRSAFVAFAILLAVFLVQVSIGSYLFPRGGKPGIDSANHLWPVLLLFAWIADWIVLFKSPGTSFSDEWRFLGSMALALIAACAGWFAYMLIGLNLYGS